MCYDKMLARTGSFTAGKLVLVSIVHWLFSYKFLASGRANYTLANNHFIKIIIMPVNKNTRSERSMDDDDIYTTTDTDRRDMKGVNLSDDDDLSIPTSTFTDELFSSTKDEDEEMENGVRKLPLATGTRRRPRSFCCICQRVVTPFLVILFLVIFCICYFGDSSVLEGIIPGTDMLFATEDLGEQFVWQRSNVDGGLTLKIVNALDTEWYTYFDVAVYDWDNGSPDALTLSSEVASAPDPDCAMIEGVLKICNGDYGNTGWMGINEVLKFENGIAGSVGKMNDYFFGSSLNDHAKRQYTMCHEMGHGFGLPHTDTTLWNRNTGNCLDYTNRPKKNMRPGQINYDRLVAVYGTVGNTTAPSGSNAAPTGSPNDNSSNTANNDNTNISTNAPVSNDDDTGDNQQGSTGGNNGAGGPNNEKNDDNNNPDDKNNRSRRDLSSIPQSFQPIPADVTEQLRQIREEYHQMTTTTTTTTVEHSNIRRYLTATSSVGSSNDQHKNNADHYEIDLGSGYTVQIALIHAF